ncbi:MAG TPA: cyanophycin synthetase, partial [Armatimonadota bacterium]|nr:cyanophycin synthetase [Armatimonadota bacterium]
EAIAVIERAAADKDAPLWRIGRDFDYTRQGYAEGWQRFNVRTPLREYQDLMIPMAGAFQVENAATAVAALDLLETRGQGIEEAALRQGLAEVHMPGRMEMLRKKPRFLIDGAHNAASAQALAQALRELYGERRIILILGVSTDHSVADVVGALAPLADHIIVTAADNPRAQDAAVIAQEAMRYTTSVETVESVSKAVKQALALARPEDVICATGSFFLIGEIDREQVALPVVK